MRIGLVGCVKQKRAHAVLARELYVSPLFRGRRSYVERSCDRWFILSAEHGLVEPDATLAPYEKTLNDASARERQAWSRRVLADLERCLGPLRGIEFEGHAGSAYLDHGLVGGIRARGASVEVPARGLRLGQQLAFYKSAAR
jgi:hypothetical protein